MEHARTREDIPARSRVRSSRAEPTIALQRRCHQKKAPRIQCEEQLYEDLFERGRSFIRNLRSPATRSVEDTTGLLERLARLREQGAVDEDEFERLKREIFAAAT